jgi:hypothetical protein
MKKTLVFIIALGVAASWLTGCSPKKPAADQAAPPTDVATAHGGMGGESSAEPSQGAPGGAPQGAMGGMPQGGVVAPPPGGSPTAAAGLAWTLPAGWSVEPPRSMRVATYAVPAAGDDKEGAECAVYYFGKGQGGGVEANLQRWIAQFQPETKSKRSTRKVDGMPVTLADVSGTYTAHGGSMGQAGAPVTGWRLLGAIVEGPEGAVFFKLTGPEKTVAAASKGFDALVGSLKKQ